MSAAVRTIARLRSLHAPDARAPAAPSLLDSAAQLPWVALAVATASMLIAGAQLTGTAPLLHHHALIEHGPPLWIAVPAFLGAWLVMILAMMVPGSMPAILSATPRAGGARHILAFIAPYVLVWGAFGLAIFAGDAMLHRVVDATPWLAARPWLIDTAIFAIAGIYQLTPFKRRSLDACRHPATLLGADLGHAGWHRRPGAAHATACLTASWALMLLMFSEGFSSPWPMLALTGVMLYESTGRFGQLVRHIVGAILIGLAVGVAITGISI